MREVMFLAVAAVLEVAGDALVRWGLKGGRWYGMAMGAAVLFGYGLSVNLPKWDFSRLMGVYIATFFVLTQVVAVVFFHERIPLPTLVGGALILAGGILITVWRVQ